MRPSRMYLAMRSPCAEPLLRSARRRSPADKWTKPHSFTRRSHCVPLPAPGPPRTNSTLGRFANSGVVTSVPAGASSAAATLAAANAAAAAVDTAAAATKRPRRASELASLRPNRKPIQRSVRAASAAGRGAGAEGQHSSGRGRPAQSLLPPAAVNTGSRDGDGGHSRRARTRSQADRSRGAGQHGRQRVRCEWLRLGSAAETPMPSRRDWPGRLGRGRESARSGQGNAYIDHREVAPRALRGQASGEIAALERMLLLSSRGHRIKHMGQPSSERANTRHSS